MESEPTFQFTKQALSIVRVIQEPQRDEVFKKLHLDMSASPITIREKDMLDAARRVGGVQAITKLTKGLTRVLMEMESQSSKKYAGRQRRTKDDAIYALKNAAFTMELGHELLQEKPSGLIDEHAEQQAQ